MNDRKKECADFVSRTMADLPRYKKMLTVGDVAQALGVSRQTVRRYIWAGWIKSFELPKADIKNDRKKICGKIFRIPLHAYENFLRSYEAGKSDGESEESDEFLNG